MKYRVYVETSIEVEAPNETEARQSVSRMIDCASMPVTDPLLNVMFANMRSSDDWDVAKEG